VRNDTSLDHQMQEGTRSAVMSLNLRRLVLAWRNASSFESTELAASIGLMPSIDISVGGRVGVPFRSPGLPTALNVLVGGMVIVSELTREETAEAY
jgi:hypothetical protein